MLDGVKLDAALAQKLERARVPSAGVVIKADLVHALLGSGFEQHKLDIGTASNLELQL